MTQTEGGVATANHAAHGMWIRGSSLVVPARGAVLPARCVRCDAPATKRLTRTLYWHPPAYYALVLLGLIPYFLIQLVVRQQANVVVAVCPRHQRRRTLGIAAGWAGSLAVVAAFPLVVDRAPAAALAMLAGLVVFPAMGIILSTVVRADRIGGGYVWLGVGLPFLRSAARELEAR